MLKVLLPYTLILVIALGSCKQKESVQIENKERSEMDSVSYVINTVDKSVGHCYTEGADPCAEVYLQLLKITQHGSAWELDSIQNSVDKEFLNLSNFDSSKIYTSQQLINGFLDEFSQIISELPDYVTRWEMERSADINFNKLGILGISLFDYSYTGGAHGNSFVQFLNYDLTTGKELKLNTFIKDVEGSVFATFSENQFRKSQRIKIETPWADADFWFEEGFYLPENFKISDLGLHFIYNSYEIAPYTVGQIELFISWQELQPYLNLEWQALFVKDAFPTS